jgi:hypothetical protein
MQLDFSDAPFHETPSSAVNFDSLNTTASSTTLTEGEAEQSALGHAAKTEASKPIFYSQLKQLAKKRIIPELREEDLDEVFVRGTHGTALTT